MHYRVRPRGMPYRMYLPLRGSEPMWQKLLGYYELAKTTHFRRVLKPGMTVVDAGGNHGYFTLLAASLVGPAGRVLSFEPSPENCHWIRRGVAANGFENVHAFEVALADRSGALPLQLCADSGGHSIAGAPMWATGEAIEVATERLDCLLQKAGVDRVDLLKIDVEGAEMSVLAGAERMLAAPHDMSVAIDIHPWLGVDADGLLALLEDYKFKVSHMDGRPILPAERHTLKEVLAVKRVR